MGFLLLYECMDFEEQHNRQQEDARPLPGGIGAVSVEPPGCKRDEARPDRENGDCRDEPGNDPIHPVLSAGDCRKLRFSQKR